MPAFFRISRISGVVSPGPSSNVRAILGAVPSPWTSVLPSNCELGAAAANPSTAASPRKRRRTKQIMESIFKLTTEKYERHVRIYFEVLALATHNENIKNTLKDDYAKDLKATCEFIERLASEQKIRIDVDSEVLAQSLRSIWMGTAEKMVLGYGNEKLREDWFALTLQALGAVR